MRQQWSKQRILDTIKQQHKLGNRLNAWHVACHNLPLLKAGTRYFGSWEKAIRGAGIRYKDIRRTREAWKWSRDIVIAQIRQMHDAGEPLNSNDIQKRNLSLFAAATKYCGGWGEAVTAAGIDYAKVRKYRPGRHWTKKGMVRAIHVRKRAGHGLSTTVMQQEDYGLSRAARGFFGKNGWRKALVAAGIDPIEVMDPRRIWTRKKLIAEIQRRWKDRQLLYAFYLYQIGQAGMLTAGIRFYGSWRKTVEAAGLDYEEVRACKRGWWSKRRIVAEIRRVAGNGTRLSPNAMEDMRGDLTSAARVYFGSWQAAVEAAGFDYRRHWRIWSMKAWLRAMTPAQLKEVKARTVRFAAERRRGR